MSAKRQTKRVSPSPNKVYSETEKIDVNVLLLNQPVYIAQQFRIGHVSYFHCSLRLMLKGV